MMADARATASGAPTAETMVRMSAGAETEPYTTGVPGDTSWARTSPARISALAKASKPDKDIGPLVPAITIFVMTSGWRIRAIAMIASASSPEYFSGDMACTIVAITGRRFKFSRPSQTIAAISRPSLVACLDMAVPTYVLSQSTISANSMSRWAIWEGMSAGWTINIPFISSWSDVCTRRQQLW